MLNYEGFVEENSETYYVSAGMTWRGGLTKIDGAYYYFSTTNGKMAVNVTRLVAGNCIDASASDMKEGTYTFGADGKMVIVTKEGFIDGYYYVNGEIQKIFSVSELEAYLASKGK